MSEPFTKEDLDHILTLSKEELREKGIKITYTDLRPDLFPETEDITEEDIETEQRVMAEFEKILFNEEK